MSSSISSPYLSLSHTLQSHLSSLSHYSPHTSALISLASDLFTQWRKDVLNYHDDDDDVHSSRDNLQYQLRLIKQHEEAFRNVLREYYTQKKLGKWQEKYEKDLLLGGMESVSPHEFNNAEGLEGRKDPVGANKALISIDSRHWRDSNATSTPAAAASKLKSKTQHTIQSNLQQTRSLLSAQLETSDASMMIVSEMSHLLRDTLRKQHDYEHSVRQSGKKISSLKSRDNWDYYVNRGAFIFFIAVCAYIFNKRLRLFSLAFRIIWWFMRLFMVWRWFGWGSAASPSSEMQGIGGATGSVEL